MLRKGVHPREAEALQIAGGRRLTGGHEADKAQNCSSDTHELALSRRWATLQHI
jgi:hypothetical protein